MELLSHVPYTNQSFNSKAAVIGEIQKEEQIHWYWGLRSAEGFIDDKQSSLAVNYRKQRQYEREINKKKRQLTALNEQEYLTPDEEDTVAELQDAIDEYEFNMNRLKWQIRDCVMELNAAIGEFKRIVAAHPEVEKLTYEELQEICTTNAMLERQAYYLAARDWSVSNGLPETMGVAMFSAAPSIRGALMSRMADVSTQASLEINEFAMRQQEHAQVDPSLKEAMEIINSLSPDQQTKAILTAARLITGE